MPALVWLSAQNTTNNVIAQFLIKMPLAWAIFTHIVNLQHFDKSFYYMELTANK
tara:strand:- start:1214 stop:1375 length:162 start_codon:yes stop_codon:yes gene_type:complete